MRYSKAHKAETRARIEATAAPLFRRFGFNAVSVDKLMNASKLTRGGFYAHFDSKETLIESILNRNAGLVRMMSERDGTTRASLNEQALQILKDYLNPQNLEEIVEGCPLATMPIDAARASPRIRSAYGERFKSLIKQLMRGFGKSRNNEDDAIAAAVLAVGGIVFALASEDKVAGKRIEEACLRKVAQLFDHHPGVD